MSLLQIIMAVIGGLIVLSYFIDFKALLSNFKKKETEPMAEKTQDVIILKNPRNEAVETQSTLASVVAQWEKLKADCEGRGLIEASAKLEEVFPLLIKKG